MNPRQRKRLFISIRQMAVRGPAFLFLSLMLSACQLPMDRLFARPVPTPQCIKPTLKVGSLEYQVDSVKRNSGDFPAIPQNMPDTAYWVEGTNINYVFGLSSANENQALGNKIKPGDAISITWADCSNDAYIVQSVKPLSNNNTAIFDQSSGGITVFVEAGASSAGVVIHGTRPQASSNDTPGPAEANAVQASVLFLNQTTSADGKSITLDISVQNTGSSTITISTGTISLTGNDNAAQAPIRVTPPLPIEINSGKSQNLSIIFPKPSGNTAVFKILDFSVNIYFY